MNGRIVVGYTAEPALTRLSNLMAYDATAWGNWGCDPALYPEALALVASAGSAPSSSSRATSFCRPWPRPGPRRRKIG